MLPCQLHMVVEHFKVSHFYHYLKNDLCISTSYFIFEIRFHKFKKRLCKWEKEEICRYNTDFCLFDNKLWTLKKVQVRNILSSILFQAGRATF